MTLKEFGEAFEFNIRNNLKYAVLGLGAPGVGKSQIIKQIGNKYGYKVIDIRLAQMSEVEIGGLIYPNEDKTKTVWLSPEILPNEERDGERTILLLDEITSCTKRVQVAAYQLILDRRIGQYRLPEGCFVVALGNREDDDGVYINLAGPLADRFEIHYIEPDFESWKYEYAINNGIHPYVIDYLTFKPAALHTQAVEEEGAMIFATPRSWERVSDILRLDDNIASRVIFNKIIGNIGTREGRQFVEFCKKEKDAVSADEFIEGIKPAPMQADELTILVQNIVRKCGFTGEIKYMSELLPEQRYRAEKIISALFRLPMAEFTIIGLKGVLQINREIVKTIICEMNAPTIEKFINDNSRALGINSEANSWMAMWN